MTMMLFRGCPKCHGDLQINDDIYGRYLQCLQCGFHQDLPSDVSLREALSQAGYPVAVRQRRRHRPAA